MQFVLLISCAPHSAAMRRALCFARELLAQEHSIGRLFFYQDAVHVASALQVCAQDEQHPGLQWQQLIQQHSLDAVGCVAAALRRGVVDQAEADRYRLPASNLLSGFTLSGLGQLHEAMQDGDRLLHFKGEA